MNILVLRWVCDNELYGIIYSVTYKEIHNASAYHFFIDIHVQVQFLQCLPLSLVLAVKNQSIVEYWAFHVVKTVVLILLIEAKRLNWLLYIMDLWWSLLFETVLSSCTLWFKVLCDLNCIHLCFRTFVEWNQSDETPHHW